MGGISCKLLTEEQTQWLMDNISNEDYAEIMKPIHRMVAKCKQFGMLCGGITGIGSWILLKQKAPAVDSAVRFFLCLSAFNFVADFGGKRVGYFLFLLPYAAERDRIMLYYYEKYMERQAMEKEEPSEDAAAVENPGDAVNN